MICSIRLWLMFLCLLQTFYITESKECVKKEYGKNRIVCVCNSTYCDEFPTIDTIQNGEVVVITSSISGKRFQVEKKKIEKKGKSLKKLSKSRIKVDPRQTFQEIHGFGGAFTDSAGINLASLSKDAQQKLLESYFGENGIQYTLGRVPIASTDFSTREYSYAEVPDDFKLDHFQLKEDDFKYKINYIKEALKLTKNNLRLFASPWSSPAWMKSNNKMTGGGALKDDLRVHRAYANYFVRFFEEYDKNGINFWAVTIENEPSAGSIPTYKWQSLFFSASTERDFVRDYLGPTLKSHLLTSNLTIICLDDNRMWLPVWADIMFEDEKANEYVEGIGVHWYGNGIFPAHLLTTTHNRHPNKFILATEACAGYQFPHGPFFGDWLRAEQYAYDIIIDLNNYVTGWMDWNLCLNMNGGPTWVNNVVDSPILVNATNDEFYKQPMFYAMGHFSKYIRPGFQRVATKLDTSNPLLQIVTVAQHERRVMVVLNKSDENDNIFIEDALMNDSGVSISIEAHSIVTIIWNKQF